jgi:hypothetical protein
MSKSRFEAFTDGVFAFAISLIVPVVSFGLYLIIAAYYLVPRGVDADLPRDPQ